MARGDEDLVWYCTQRTNPLAEMNHSASFKVTADFEVPHCVEDRYL